MPVEDEWVTTSMGNWSSVLCVSSGRQRRTHVSSVSPRDKEASLFIYQFLEELKVTLGGINSPSLLVSWSALVARECSPAVILLVCIKTVCG